MAGKLEKLGWHASDTGELAFDDVFVPEENLLGDENRGFYLIMANFQWERLLMALGAVGSMETVLERVIEAARGRTEFRHTVAELGLKLEASRALTAYALYLFATGHDAIREVTEAKLSPSAPHWRWPRPRFASPTATSRSAGPCATRGWGRSAAAPTR